MLNERITHFDYGYSHSNSKPPILNARWFKEDNMKMKYSASEMMTMANVLPFLVGDKLAESDQHYQCFLLLIRILQICLAPVVTDTTVSYLRVLIEEHNQQFADIYGEDSFIPKLHYLLHYPHQIVKHGPLVHCWTMRHEGKLNFFKQAARFSRRHQRWLAYHLETESLFIQKITRGPIVSCSRLCEVVHLEAMLHDTCDPQTLITQLKWIKINTLKYMPNIVILLYLLMSLSPHLVS